jgi:hypothetical protein
MLIKHCAPVFLGEAKDLNRSTATGLLENVKFVMKEGKIYKQEH